MAQADGQEVLVLDGDEKVRKGLGQLLSQANLVPTTLADSHKALEMAREKFFAVALVDLDTPQVGAGIELIQKINACSPATTVLVMAARKSFEVAVAAFRAGAFDVIVKAPDQIPYLQERVVAAAAGKRAAQDTSHLVEDVLQLHEELMQVLLTSYRKAAELEEKSSGDALNIDEETYVLVVDADGSMQSQLAAMARQKGGYQLRGAASGGEALDQIGRQRFHIVLVREDLPDLPGSMVVRTIKSQSPNAIALLYAAPTGHSSGNVQVIETSRVIPFVAQFSEPSQILERMDELRDAVRATERERRYLASFRQNHFDLLKRYAELKQKLQRSVADGSSLHHG